MTPSAAPQVEDQPVDPTIEPGLAPPTPPSQEPAQERRVVGELIEVEDVPEQPKETVLTDS